MKNPFVKFNRFLDDFDAKKNEADKIKKELDHNIEKYEFRLKYLLNESETLQEKINERKNHCTEDVTRIMNNARNEIKEMKAQASTEIELAKDVRNMSQLDISEALLSRHGRQKYVLNNKTHEIRIGNDLSLSNLHSITIESREVICGALNSTYNKGYLQGSCNMGTYKDRIKKEK